jgi:hypothetical protein
LWLVDKAQNLARHTRGKSGYFCPHPITNKQNTPQKIPIHCLQITRKKKAKKMSFSLWKNVKICYDEE